MNGRAKRRSHAATVAFVAVALASPPAFASAPSIAECIAANERAIDLRNHHRYVAARGELLTCANPDCPDEVRDECVHGIAEVNLSLPTIVFEAKDAEGTDLVAVRVTMDGKPFVDQLQGVAVELDPGEHTFVFGSAHHARVEKRLMILEGVKAQRESVIFGPPQQGAAQHTSDTRRIVGWTSIGLGAVGLGVGVVFAVVRARKLDDAASVCAGDSCPSTFSDHELRDAQAKSDQLIRDANGAGTVAITGFVAGGLFAAGGLALLLTAPKSAGPSSAFVVAPSVGPGYQGIAVAGRL
jgi:hypothetical protein